MPSFITNSPLRRIAVAAATVLSMCAIPAAANAATVAIEGSELVYRAGGNETNTVSVWKPSPDVFRVSDYSDTRYYSATPIAGAACSRADAHHVNCLASGVTRIRIHLGDFDDNASVSETLSVPATMYGGSGNDSLSGGSAADVLYGEANTDTLSGNGGQDVLRGGQGNDTLNGGADRDDLDGGSWTDHLYGGLGDDKLDGGPGHDGGVYPDGGDVISGGDGRDWVTYFTHARAGVRVEIDGIANDGVTADSENDNVLTDVEDLTGTAHKDNLIGSAANNHIYGAENDDRLDGGAGNDALRGEAGVDQLFGGIGMDTLYARDSAQDYAFDCGDQEDWIYVDAIDAIARNCEHII